MPDSAGGLLIPATVDLGFLCNGCRLGADVAVANLDSTGRLRTGYGRGDGFAIWNNDTGGDYSDNSIDTVLVEPSGRILLTGVSNDRRTNEWTLTRLTSNGAADVAFGGNGKVFPRQSHCDGALRTVEQPGGAIVVVTGSGAGSFCLVNGPTVALRFDASGILDTAFKPDLAPGSSAFVDVAFAARADGRLLYGTTVFLQGVPGGPNAAILQQTLPDGTPDSAFGVNGKVTIPLAAGGGSRTADLVVLGDGSVVFAFLTSTNLVLYRVDARGAPVASFGIGGRFTYSGAFGDVVGGFSGRPLFSLLSLQDGSLLAAIRLSTKLPGSITYSLLAVRISADGTLIDASNLLGTDKTFLEWSFVAMPDASVLIARSSRDATVSAAALYRLLPDNSLDAGFGVGGAYPLLGLLSVDALALDADERLLVAGQDATSAILVRYDLSGAVASMPVVEYYNTGLQHYFITAGAAEMAMIEAGGAGPGWQRTGYGFRAYLPENGVAIGALPVCRFYGTPGRGPNSHFYTVNAAECAAVKKDPGWALEGTAFYLFAPVNGQCEAGEQAVYRVYNNRFAQNDSNHRYTTDPNLYAQMQAQGWLAEGVAFCGPMQ